MQGGSPPGPVVVLIGCSITAGKAQEIVVGPTLYELAASTVAIVFVFAWHKVHSIFVMSTKQLSCVWCFIRAPIPTGQEVMSQSMSRGKSCWTKAYGPCT